MVKPSSASEEFDEFVRQQQPTEEERRIDWNKERDEWLAHLEHLYEQILSYLQPYIAGDTIIIGFSDITLTEENIGVYKARKMNILIGRQRVALTPVGTLLVGTKGRVDVEGIAGRSRLVLVDKGATTFAAMFKVTVTINLKASDRKPSETPQRKPIEWTWKIVPSSPTGHFIDLSKDSLFEMLLRVSNG
jgi:hypothetical protein